MTNKVDSTTTNKDELEKVVANLEARLKELESRLKESELSHCAMSAKRVCLA